MNNSCNINDSHFCQRCNDRKCSKVPIIKIILTSGDKRKINNLSKVLGAFDVKVTDLIS